MREVPDWPFDVTFARLLLFHVRDRIAVLKTMYDLTKPGGYIVAQDYDLSAFAIIQSWRHGLILRGCKMR
jgi:SAM-dependent methyltransferase